ncbi:hypothetical protein [Sorangium sp. So ce1335]|uniref:hypothetical protein n=1 Tax=Sorangium sp. So ce1335 TaxID=3133335 RepID=UPI003F600634
MLARHRHSFLAFTLIFPALYGCVVSSTDTDNDVEQATGVGVTSSSSTGGDDGEGGWGGDDGEGGWGGDGGWGGEGGGGGGQGGGACVDYADGNLTVAACDELNISPTQGATSQCGDNRNEEPIGYGLCQHGFVIFAPGHAADLVDCLSDIPVQEACDEPPVQECMDRVYANACPDQAEEICEAIEGACDDTFETATCNAQLNPFNRSTKEALVDCMNADDQVTCKQAYDACYLEALYFEG